MRRSVCVQIALISICLVYLIVNGTTIIQTILINSKESLSEQIRSESEHYNEVLKGKPKTEGSGHILEYLEKIFQYNKNLASKDCQKWNLINTPSHKYVLPVLTQKSENVEKGSNEEDDKHRIKSFEKIFDTNAWGQESKSGPGSLIPATGRIRNVLDSVIEETKKYLKKDKIRCNKICKLTVYNYLC